MPLVIEADKILRSCVHCGLCNAVCPTYQLLGDELDGPRGRIYLIKNLLEEDHISSKSTEHIDRCLNCRACETSCPSRVRFGRLLDIGRRLIAERNTPTLYRRTLSWVLRNFLSRKNLFGFFLSLGQFLKPVLPQAIAGFVPLMERKRGNTIYGSCSSNDSGLNKGTLKALMEHKRAFSEPSLLLERQRRDTGTLKAPKKHLRHHATVVLKARNAPRSKETRRVLLLQGCVQQVATPNVNRALEKLLAIQGVEFEYLAKEGCCGALDYHLSAHRDAMEKIKLHVDRLYQRVDRVDHILSSASGCGVTIKEYPEILGSESPHHSRAQAVVSKVMDVSEYLSRFEFGCRGVRVAVHTPCTLQHGQKLPDEIESLLLAAGIVLVPAGEKHLCCGSAGTYSIMQPTIANDLTSRKIIQLTENQPDIIVTGNIGCQLQLQAATKIPVMHWVEFLADNLV